jgi:hypothetical protein
MGLDQLASFASLAAVIAGIVGGYAVHRYRTDQQDKNIQEIKAAHEAEVKLLRERMDRMDATRNDQYSSIMIAINNLATDVGNRIHNLTVHMGNRLTRIETILKIEAQQESLNEH